jgi:hypothetical protein
MRNTFQSENLVPVVYVVVSEEADCLEPEAIMKFSETASAYRNRFIQDIDASILRLDRIQNGDSIALGYLRIHDNSTLEFRLYFGGRGLILPNDDHILTAETFDDLIEQLDQIKIIAGFGGLDSALAIASRESHSLPHHSC